MEKKSPTFYSDLFPIIDIFLFSSKRVEVARQQYYDNAIIKELTISYYNMRINLLTESMLSGPMLRFLEENALSRVINSLNNGSALKLSVTIACDIMLTKASTVPKEIRLANFTHNLSTLGMIFKHVPKVPQTAIASPRAIKSRSYLLSNNS